MQKLLLNERFMLSAVTLNVIIIFLQGCGLENGVMGAVDILCTVIFICEMVLKHRLYGVRGYWKDGWNILDGTVTLLSLPSLLVYFLPTTGGMKILVTLRALRVFKSFRTVRHFPNIKEIWKGFRLAMRQSAGFLIGYLVIIVVIAMFNSALFSESAPQYFKTPLDAIYTVFQLFTVEGWYDIPNAVAGDMAPIWVHIVRFYFCVLLIGGGIIGMSLINSIFVDALAADNNDDVKAKLDAMEQQMAENQRQMEQKIDDLQQTIERLTGSWKC
jgi:voltage-gated sodium channel